MNIFRQVVDIKSFGMIDPFDGTFINHSIDKKYKYQFQSYNMLDRRTDNTVIDWCKDQKWESVWDYNVWLSAFVTDDPDAALAFKLRWC